MYFAAKSFAKFYCNCRIVERHLSRIRTATKKLTKRVNQVEWGSLSSLLGLTFYNELKDNDFYAKIYHVVVVLNDILVVFLQLQFRASKVLQR